MKLRTMPPEGARRVIKTICWYPRTVAGVVYWLQFLKIEQEFTNLGSCGWWTNKRVVR